MHEYPRIVVVSSLGAHHRYIIQELQREWTFQALLIPVWESSSAKKKSKINVLRRICAHPFREIRNRINTRFAHRVNDSLNKAIAANLLSQPDISSAEHISCDDLNSTVGQEKLKELKPDILLVLGGPILSQEFLSVPTMGALNIHFGHIPAYRGQYNLFFALMNEDYENVASTIHHMNGILDGGALITRVRPAYATSDDEVSILCSHTKMIANELLSILSYAAKEKALPVGKQVDISRSQLYKFRDRGPLVEMKWQSLRRRSKTSMNIPQFIERFY